MTNANMLKLKTDTTSLYQLTLEYSNGEHGPLLSTDSEFTRIWSSYSEIRRKLIALDEDIFSSLRDIKQPEPDITNQYVSDDYSAKSLQPLIYELKTAIQYIDIYEKKQPASSKITKPIDTLKLLCTKFHLVARQLSDRRENRETLKINDEYDLQDLFRSLLYIFFDDIRKEEWTPSYAGGASRLDFLLKNEEIIIELKMTRKGLDARLLGEQLIVDIEKYKTHPNCKYIFCFTYDPESIIRNPIGIENDLTKNHDEISVHLIIEPK